MKVSNSQNVPMLSEQHQARISASTGTETIGIQSSYSITNSLAIMGEFSYGLDELPWDNDTYGDLGTRYSGELALGYYRIQKQYDTTLPFHFFEIYI